MERLKKRTEVIIVDDDNAALELIEKYRAESRTQPYEVTAGTYVIKEKKSKGEIIDSWAEVTITMTYSYAEDE